MTDSLFTETRAHILKLIKAMIADGQEKLPTEKELAEQVTASYGTVRLVMKKLVEDGYVRKVPGSGTYLKTTAAELLKKETWHVCWLFTPPFPGKPDDDYGAWLVHSLQTAADRHGWKIRHYFVRSHDEFLNQMRRKVGPYEAAIYLPPTESFSPRQLGELARFENQPLVIVDMELNNISLCNITTDNRYGGMIAARELIKRGCQRLLALLCEPHTCNLSARLRGFSEIAELHGLKPELLDCHMPLNGNREQLTFRYTLERLRSAPLPDGIFAISDSGALGAYRALNELGLIPGRDINLIGFDGLVIGRKLDPVLATVVQPMEDITAAIFETLRDWQPGRHSQQLLSPRFGPGGSVGQLTSSPLYQESTR